MSHMGGHVGQRPRLCHNCGLGFAQQQGYDNHLKTCGQIPASVSALKKRWASNSSPPPMKSTLQPVEKLQLPTTASMNASSLAHTTVKVHTDVTNIPAAPVKELISQGHVTEGMSGGSGQSEGVFQLTHDKLPPPALNLVLFVPVPSTVPQTLPAVDVLVKPPVALPLAPKAEPTFDLHEAASCVGVNSVSGAQLHIDSPLDLVSARKQDPVSVVPLDLSKKFISPLPSFTQAPSVKIEPEDPTFSEEVETETFPRTDCVEQNIKSSETMPESDRQTAAKQLKPMEFSTSPGLIVDIKKELDSPGLDFHMVSSESCLLTVESPAKEIKMEVDE
ncbi:uncharacterized protein LOC130118449 [Lampris incognitus]|uniref:uncharacterized protein LOC130118449 n=1 Tax=Lampris incognitus TaxID=2546036 RepID=UPI0024B49C20|nr:uncharacterized protein LOC130118449 [Lampris incognitus]